MKLTDLVKDTEIKKTESIKFISKLLHSKEQAERWHRQVTPKALSSHLALETYYKTVIDNIDDLTECYQGLKGKIIGYEPCNFISYVDNQQLINYFTELFNYINVNRNHFEDSCLLNIIDEIKQKILKTLYKLQNL